MPDETTPVSTPETEPSLEPVAPIQPAVRPKSKIAPWIWSVGGVTAAGVLGWGFLGYFKNKGKK